MNMELQIRSQIWVLSIEEDYVGGKIRLLTATLTGKVSRDIYPEWFDTVNKEFKNLFCCEIKKGAKLQIVDAYVRSINGYGVVEMACLSEPQDY